MTSTDTAARPLRILFLEDSADDLALLVRSLRKAGYDPAWEQVEDEAAFRAAIEQREWDVVLADYSLPHYSAAEAIILLREIRPYLPMIVVSGNVGEETAVAVVKAGAVDYVMKDSLARLAPAIDREIREAMDRRERDRLADRSGQHAQAAFKHAPAALLLLSNDNCALVANEAACQLLQASHEEILGSSLTDLLGLDNIESGATVEANPPGLDFPLSVTASQTPNGGLCCLLRPLDPV